MPKPNPGESKKDYISRFMGNPEARSDFPDEKQRLAVAYSMYEHKNATPSYGQEFPWPKMYEATYIEPGVVHYQDLGPCEVCGDKFTCGNDADGTSLCRPEGATVLVKAEALERMGRTLIGKPVIDVIHKNVTSSTIADGEADGIVTDEGIDPNTGWRKCRFLVWNPECQKHCDDNVTYSVSCAYDPMKATDEGGEWHNVEYASEILDGQMTHLAIVSNPRYEGARIARILVNSKGGRMTWKFWEKGARKNAAPLDPSKELVDVDGEKVPLQNLYDALDEEKPKYNDDTILETPKGEKTMGELKQAYRNRTKKNAEPTGEHIKTSAPADTGHAEHDEGKGGFEHAGACDHCRHPAFNSEEKKDGEQKPLPDLRQSEDNPSQAEKAAKELDAKLKEKQTLELQQKADDEAKAAEEKKNAEDKAKEEMRQAEEAAAKEKELKNKKDEGKKSFAALKNARLESTGADVKVNPISLDDRLAKGRSKYGSV